MNNLLEDEDEGTRWKCDGADVTRLNPSLPRRSDSATCGRHGVEGACDSTEGQ